ncbi:MAG: VWA domain-containing protein [Polyangiales bacterium]
MKHHAALSLLILTSAYGCAGQLRVQSSADGTGVRASVRGDGRAVAAAGALAAGIAALAAGGSEDSQTAPPSPVHTPASTWVAGGLSVRLAEVVLVDEATGARVSTVAEGALRVSGAEGALNGGSISGGTLRVRAGADATSFRVVDGDLSTSTGRSLRVGAGELTVASRGQGRCAVTSGGVVVSAVRATPEVVATASPAEASVRIGVGVEVGVVRVAVGGGADVLGGGTVRVDGAPDLRGLRVIDGRLDPRGGAGGLSARASGRASARVEVGGGVLLLEDGRGRRWRCRVEGGSVVASTEGANPQGVAVWTPSDATLRVSVTVQGDMRLALTGDAPSSPLASSPVALSARVMGALDALILAAPEGSPESLRLASAVQVSIRQAESADPAVYAVPVVGRSVALLLDVSYSMRDLDPAAVWFELGPEARPTKLDVARAELVKVLASLPEGTSVNLIAFSTRARSIWSAPRTIDAASLDEAIRWLVALRPADETHPAEAIELAASMRPEQIVMISDGRPSGDAEDGRGLLGFVQGISSRTRLDVVGVGPDQDRDFLAALALSGHGSLRVR